jgi:hypothetical protein
MGKNPVSSSSLASVGYDVSGAVLEVEFNHGGVYQYSGVPEEVYQGLMNAGSHGTFYNEFIKKAGYPCSKIG